MSENVIEIEGLGKQYRLGQVGTTTLSDDLKRFWYRVRGKEDPFLLVGEENDRAKTGDSDYVWALRDINFSVQKGDVLGIIGKNGAGKSTLLKILSRTTSPTTGSYKIKGRIASLLEVGTGFHPDLTGRENIYLNGAILGMSRQEVKEKFDEIVEFSGIERYIDTPVKRYSSGMYVRLAFAVAAHLDPEILIVDEVLAVGDAEFQEKCLGKMKDVAGQGRTVLFVSHNMNAVSKLCSRAILIQNGKLVANGNVPDIMTEYLSKPASDNPSVAVFADDLKKDIQISKASLINEKGELIFKPINVPDKFLVEIVFTVHRFIRNAHITMDIKNHEGEYVIFSDKTDHTGHYAVMEPGSYTVRLEFPNPLLNVGKYLVSIGCMDNDADANRHIAENILRFEIQDTTRFRPYHRPGSVLHIFKWDLKKN